MLKIKYIRELPYLLWAFGAPLTGAALLTTGCFTTQAQQVQTLKGVGLSAKLSIDTAAIMLREGKITIAEWERIADVYNNQFQPLYRAAVSAAQHNEQAPAGLKLTEVTAQLASLVASIE